jgi:hypothetical protein
VNQSILAFVLVTAVAGVVSPVFAQEEAGAFYLQGGVMFAHQDGVTGESPQTYVAAPGGTTTGWAVGAGVFAAPFLSIEGELSSTGLMTAREPSRYGITYNEERRDRFIGGNVRFHAPSASPVHLEPLVGLALIHHEGWSTTERMVSLPQPHVEIDQRRAHDLPNSVALTTGADLLIEGGRHFAVLPSFRWIIRLGTGTNGDFEITGAYPDGFPRYTLSGGVLARVVF